MENGKQYVVNFRDKYCSYQEWSISGLPCRHVVACVPRTMGKLEDLCDEYFSVKSYLKTYETVIHPLPEADLDAHNDIEKLQPPPFKRLASRPRSSRRRAACEPTPRRRSSTVRCSIYKHFGHNKKGCQRAPINDKSSQKVLQPINIYTYIFITCILSNAIKMMLL
ncbi:hypothetical protein CFOL_v3_08693 [Cephalotus follicularis]|uniref:SWIM-type domain-containing protein n=1 Tax=Cephalotus follicularis TaxID=3775 RepID=A0A1Q3BB23_CEPFO|nr:hypothetical protein CFOL_v3_08693 [Cephalotus follicularis]